MGPNFASGGSWNICSSGRLTRTDVPPMLSEHQFATPRRASASGRNDLVDRPGMISPPLTPHRTAPPTARCPTARCPWGLAVRRRHPSVHCHTLRGNCFHGRTSQSDRWSRPRDGATAACRVRRRASNCRHGSAEGQPLSPEARGISAPRVSSPWCSCGGNSGGCGGGVRPVAGGPALSRGPTGNIMGRTPGRSPGYGFGVGRPRGSAPGGRAGRHDVGDRPRGGARSRSSPDRGSPHRGERWVERPHAGPAAGHSGRGGGWWLS